jgi:succinylglutamate desuccinylase
MNSASLALGGDSAAIDRIAIVGGTHGNELTGVYLVRKFQQYPELLHRDSLTVTTLLSNPRAIAENRRYIDRDLNRCFVSDELVDRTLMVYEEQRAKEITELLAPAGQKGIDMILDLHTTTANMGLSILPSSNHPFNLQLGAYLTTLDPSVRVCLGESHGPGSPMLRSLAPLGCTIEVGPVPQGVLNAELFEKTEMLIKAILDYVDAHNRGATLPTPNSLTLYQAIGSLDYPRDASGELQGAVHPQLQFQDYQPLAPGHPVFRTFLGESIGYQGDTTVFPVFINEAAYYEKNIAIVLTEQRQIAISS